MLKLISKARFCSAIKFVLYYYKFKPFGSNDVGNIITLVKKNYSFNL